MGYAQEKKAQQKVSTLQCSHRKPAGWLAGWELLAIFLLPLGILSVFVFSAVTLTKPVLCGVSILEGSALFLGKAPGEWKRHQEGDLVLRNGNAHPTVHRHTGSCSNRS